MNRFRTRKKAKESARRKDESPPAIPNSKPITNWGKKGQADPPKFEFDLSSALPPSDDFRTSLLMPKLSARFSMLREQDDPTTKIGKANDDSVLYPKRSSRLNMFSHTELTDIAEVSSLAGSTRPSLNIVRGSFGSGDGDSNDDDYHFATSAGAGMMSRPRPGEGNILFGGRQKIYKIPVNSTLRNGTGYEAGSGGSMGGKAIYESDVTLSAFQRLREMDRQRQMDGAPAMIPPQDDEQQQQQQHQQQRGFEENGVSQFSSTLDYRTSTSTTSLDSHSRTSGHGSVSVDTSNNSTATTTPAKSPVTATVERQTTKARRLYGQGLDLHSQQSSTINRLESLERHRAVANDALHMNRSLSKSSTSLNERFHKLAPVYASSSFRATSPPSSTSSIQSNRDTNNREGGTTNHVNFSSTPSGCSTVRSISPPQSENADDMSVFAAAIQPEDRGKATATGWFNKPATKYDEVQFSRRQVQMYEGRNTPPLRRASPNGGTAFAREETTRQRGLSITSNQSKVESLATQSRLSESQDEGSLRNGERSAAPSIRTRSPPPRPGANGIFLVNLGESESDTDADSESLIAKFSSTPEKLHDIHPPFRHSADSVGSSSTTSLNKPSYGDSSQEPALSESNNNLQPIKEDEVGEAALPPSPLNVKPPKDSADSPTLGGGASGLGLSGLVRTHLRHDSDKSSIFPPPSPAMAPSAPPLETTNQQRDPAARVARRNHADSMHSDPWEYDHLDKALGRTEEPTAAQTTHADMSNMLMRAKQMLGQATALSNRQQQQQQSVNDSPQNKGEIDKPAAALPADGTAPWQEQLEPRHNRAGSSETQLEREEFANELAERRRKVQEKLKSFAENESRSSSPTSAHRFIERTPPKVADTSGLLKSHVGKNGRPDASKSKALRMLGMDNSAHSTSTPNLTSTHNGWRSEDEKPPHRDFAKDPRYAPGESGRQDWHNKPLPMPSQWGYRNEEHGPSHESRPPPISKVAPRDRSASDASGRSKGRHRQRDDLNSVDEYNPDRHQNPTLLEDYHDPSRVHPAAGQPSPVRPSGDMNDRFPGERLVPSVNGRLRSGSRSTVAPPPFVPDLQLSPLHNQSPIPGLSPRPSPIAPYAANTTPPLFETSPLSSAVSSPTAIPQHIHSPGGPRAQNLAGHKRLVNKSQISEPMFVSSTSNVPTVNLPPGASLSNGSTPPPSIPPMNPRRRQTQTHTIFGALRGSDRSEQSSPLPSPMSPAMGTDTGDEHSIFSDEERRSRPRQRLRKISSEGGSLHTKARQQPILTSPSVPQIPKHIATEGNMI